MEIFELKYFLGVAREENIHRAANKLNVSPGSLSKAITRLEAELSVNLFSREGRNIQLTDHGRLFQKRASEIIHLEESLKLELSGHLGTINAVIAGPEILLTKMGLDISIDLQKKYPKMRFEFHDTDDDTALGQVARGEAHLAIVTTDIPTHLGLSTKVIEEPQFQTVVGATHPLFLFAKQKKIISVEKILEHAFVSPSHPLLGKVGAKQSVDGWRDDQFPRRVGYLTSSLKMLEEIVEQGKALAYLPDYFAKKLDVEVLKISGCPYHCNQKVKVVAKNPKDRSWLNQWF